MDTWQLFVLGGMLGVLVWGVFEVITLLRGIEKRLGYINEVLSSISRDTAFLTPKEVWVERAKQSVKELRAETGS